MVLLLPPLLLLMPVLLLFLFLLLFVAADAGAVAAVAVTLVSVSRTWDFLVASNSRRLFLPKLHQENLLHYL